LSTKKRFFTITDRESWLTPKKRFKKRERVALKTADVSKTSVQPVSRTTRSRAAGSAQGIRACILLPHEPAAGLLQSVNAEGTERQTRHQRRQRGHDSQAQLHVITSLLSQISLPVPGDRLPQTAPEFHCARAGSGQNKPPGSTAIGHTASREASEN